MFEFLNKGKSEKTVRKPVIVEIGPAGMYGLGTVATSWSRKIEEDINKGAIYIGLDAKPEELKRHSKDNIYLPVAGDMGKMPFPDNSVDQIWIMNVFSGFHHLPDLVKGEDGRVHQVWVSGISKYFQELSRVIKPDGKIIIGEFGVPIGGPGAVDYLLDNTDYSRFGFLVNIYVDDNLKEGLKENGFNENLGEIAKSVNEKADENLRPFLLTLSKSKTE